MSRQYFELRGAHAPTQGVLWYVVWSVVGKDADSDVRARGRPRAAPRRRLKQQCAAGKAAPRHADKATTCLGPAASPPPLPTFHWQ